MTEHPAPHAIDVHGTRFRPNLGRVDIILMSIAATLSIDTIGQIAADGGGEAFIWTLIIAVTFMLPYGLVMAELGSTFPQEGGPYVWVRLSLGKFNAAFATMAYWITNPVWLGGSLSFLALSTVNDFLIPVTPGSPADFGFKVVFIWAAILAAIASLRYGKWLMNIGAVVKVGLVVLFLTTLVLYAMRSGVHGYGANSLLPSAHGFLATAPVILFAVVGFEAQNGAAAEMRNPQRDVPAGIATSAMVSALCYLLPILGILLVLPPDQVSGASGFMEAIKTVFTVYGSASAIMLKFVAGAFVFVLFTQGAAWMIASDRVQAVAAADGAFLRYFGTFNESLGTPLRVNMLSGIIATLFSVVATIVTNGTAASAFQVVLNIAVSTLLISYLWIFPSAWLLRRKYPHVERPYRVPGGRPGLAVATAVIYLWVAIGVWTTVFPGTLDRLLGGTYDFEQSWGLSRTGFEGFTLGTLAVVFSFCAAAHFVARHSKPAQPDFADHIIAELELAPHDGHQSS